MKTEADIRQLIEESQLMSPDEFRWMLNFLTDEEFRIYCRVKKEISGIDGKEVQL